jgi:S-adenosylmethionine-dependent methyltransferase
LQPTPALTDRAFIAELYDRGAEAEQHRLLQSPREQAEFALAKELLGEYISPDSRVLDVGAGPGRYAEYLLRERGCRVGLVDLSPRSLELFRQRVPRPEAGEILFTRTGCATQLDGLEGQSFDAVLLMGPLYHLLEAEEREAAVRHALRLLKPGGYLFATFISPFSVFPRLLMNDGELLSNKSFLDDLQHRGLAPTSTVANLPGAEQPYEFFCCWPSQARALMHGCGVEILRLRSLEGLLGLLSDEQIRPLNQSARRDAWIRFHRKHCEHPDVLGATTHYLLVGQAVDNGPRIT